MSGNIDYFRRRAAEEAAMARNTGDGRVSSIHQAMSTAYLRRVSELGAPAGVRQFENSL